MYRKTVSKEFRELILKEYPTLGSNSFYWNFLVYLVFQTTRGLVPLEISLSSKILAKMAGKDKDYKSRNFKGENYLQEFSEKIIKIEWEKLNKNVKSETIDMGNGWKQIEGKIHTQIVLKANPVWPESILKAVESERLHALQSPRVLIADGSEWTRKKMYEYRKSEQTRAIELMENAGVKPAVELLNYLNHLPRNVFNTIIKNFPAAESVAKQLETNPNGQLDMLASISEQIQPFYKPTEASVRIFGTSENITYLERSVRKALTHGWWECDLTNAQLSICARVWGVKKVQEYLEQYGKVWEGLLGWMEWDETPENKQILKKALYSICFGISQKGLTSKNGPFYRNKEACKRFLKNPLIRSLWLARKKQFEKIVKDGGAHNYFGQWLNTDKFDKKSILAQVAQSFELAILEPAIYFAQQNYGEFYITLWQHDGFSVHVPKVKRAGMWLNKLKSLVDSRAETLQICTGLEIKAN
jgi:hypothetical protein